MLPGIDLRINNLIKAIDQVILPALPDQERLAREQARLIVGHLAIIKTQWRHALKFEAGSLRAMEVLAGKLVTDTGDTGLAAALSSVATIDRDDLAAVEAAIISLGAAIDVVILGNDGEIPLSAAARDAILDYGSRQSLRERAWFIGHGLDPDKNELPAIAEVL